MTFMLQDLKRQKMCRSISNPKLWLLYLLGLIYTFTGCVSVQVPIDQAEGSRDNLYLNMNVHAPSMIKAGDRYYMFHTGRGIANWVSRDMENWIRLDPVFPEVPDWVESVVPGFDNHMRSPGIYFHDGTYYLYYSVTSLGRNNSAIGLVTNQSLNPGDPEFEWVDQGIVIESTPGQDKWNATDAAFSFDENGTPWLAFGSNRMGIRLVKLEDNLKTVAGTPAGNEWFSIAVRNQKLNEQYAGDSADPELEDDEQPSDNIMGLVRQSDSGAIEAPFIFRKGGYYYLFVSWDRCGSGVDSTCKIIVGRSETITGPYLNKTGQRMDYGGGSLVVKGNDEYAAVGHNSVYTFDGTDYLVAHGFDLSDEGRSKLIILEVTWDDEGWPVAELD